MNQNLDLTGQTFGRWEVLGRGEDRISPNAKRVYRMWTCRCSCKKHTVKDVYEFNLLNGKSNSCGCLNSEKTVERNKTHMLSNTRLYSIWSNIKKRCNNKNDPRYSSYGGRGINVCAEWSNNFLSFYTWAISNGYKDNLSIDRIDNNKGYSPNNCKWSTNQEQSNNRRSNHNININGTTKTLTEWSKQFGIDNDLVSYRIKHGWSPEKALFTPVYKGKAVVVEDDNKNSTTYPSAREAARNLNVSPSTICIAIKSGRKCRDKTIYYKEERIIDKVS